MNLVIFGFPFAGIRGFLQPLFILWDGEEVFPLLALRDLSRRLAPLMTSEKQMNHTPEQLALRIHIRTLECSTA